MTERSRLSEEDKLYLKYQIYSYRRDDPWISNKKVAKLTNHSITTVNRYAKEGEKQIVILNPQPKLYPHPDIKITLLVFENKYNAFEELKKYPGIRYMCLYHGDWDIVAVHDASVDFTEIPGYIETVVEGLYGPCLTPKTTYTSWEQFFESAKIFLEQEEKIQESIFDCNPRIPDWDKEDWEMYWYFIANLRRSFNELRKKTPISWRKYAEWKKSLADYCTILAGFFPEGSHSYLDMTLCFTTQYEKYVVDLFSHMPTTPGFTRAGEYVLANIFIPKDYSQQPKVYNINSQLVDEGIISDYKDAFGFLTYF